MTYMKISNLGTPAVVQVQAVGDRNHNPENPKKLVLIDVNSEQGELNANMRALGNSEIDIATLLSIIDNRIQSIIDPMEVIRSYENTKNK